MTVMIIGFYSDARSLEDSSFGDNNFDQIRLTKWGCLGILMAAR